MGYYSRGLFLLRKKRNVLVNNGCFLPATFIIFSKTITVGNGLMIIAFFFFGYYCIFLSNHIHVLTLRLSRLLYSNPQCYKSWTENNDGIVLTFRCQIDDIEIFTFHITSYNNALSRVVIRYHVMSSNIYFIIIFFVTNVRDVGKLFFLKEIF